MEGSNISKLVKFIGLYVVGLVLMVFIEKQFGFARKIPDNNTVGPFAIYFLIALVLPLIWTMHSNIKKGFGLFLAAYIALGMIYPRVYSSVTRTPLKKETTKSRSINGTYYSNNGTVDIYVVVGNGVWHCTVKTNAGNVFSETYGTVKGNKIIDKYGEEIGEIIKGETVQMLITGQVEFMDKL